MPEGGDDFASIVAGLGMGVTVAAEDQADLDPDDAGRDPALDRLLPTANRQDDEVAAEFRRLTETGLRQRKAGALETAADLLRGEDKLRLDAGQARAVLTALTDVRLVLGERMGLRTDEDVDVLEAAAADLDPDDPLAYALADLRLPHLAAGDAGVRDAGRVSVGDTGSGRAGRGRRAAMVLAVVLAVVLGGGAAVARRGGREPGRGAALRVLPRPRDAVVGDARGLRRAAQRAGVRRCSA